MTLRDFMTQEGYARPGADKASCPFHRDSDPSAMIHDNNNTLWCFGCRKLYTPEDFRRTFGAVFNEIKEKPQVAGEHDFGEVLFYS